MAQGNITIEFKPTGDKGLIAAIKQLDIVTKKLNGTTSKYQEEVKKTAKTQKKLLITVKNASPIYRSLTAKLKAQDKTWKSLGVSQKIVTAAAKGNLVAIERLRMAYKKTTTTTRILGGAFSVLRSKLLIYSFGVGLASKIILDQVKAFGKQEDSVRKLAVVFGSSAAKSLDKYSSELQNVTTFGDEVTNSAMATIGMYGASVEATKKLTLGTMDLATALDMDLVGAAQLVAKSIGSSTNALTRYGIAIDATASQEEKAAQVTKELERVFGGLAKAMARTTEGQITQATMALGDLQETIGGLLAPFVIIASKALKGLAKALQNPFILGASVAFSAIAISTALAATSIGAFTASLTLASIAQSAFNVVANANPYILIGSLLLGAAVALTAYFQGTKEMTQAQKDNADAIKKAAEAQAEADKIAQDYADSVIKVNEKLEKKLSILKASSAIEKFAIENGIELKDVNADLFYELENVNKALEEEKELQKSINKFYKANNKIQADRMLLLISETEFMLLNAEVGSEAYKKYQIALDGMNKSYDEMMDKMDGVDAKEKLRLKAIEDLKSSITDFAQHQIDSIRSTADARMQIMQEQENQELESLRNSRKYERASDKKKKALEEEIIARHDKQQKEEKDKANKRMLANFRVQQAVSATETIISAHQGAAKATGQLGFFGLSVASAILAAGYVSAGLILAQTPPKMEKGGIVGGRRHSQGGTMIEAEQGEYVVSRRGVDAVGIEALNRINSGGAGGINVSINNPILSKDVVEDDLIPQIKEAIRRGADIGVG